MLLANSGVTIVSMARPMGRQASLRLHRWAGLALGLAVLHALVPQQPTTPCVPAFWAWDKVRPYLMQSGELIKVVSTDPGSMRDFQAFARQTGHALVEQNKTGDDFVKPQTLLCRHANYLLSDKALIILSVTSSFGLTHTTA